MENEKTATVEETEAVETAAVEEPVVNEAEVTVTETAEAAPEKKKSNFGAKFKEWGRKQIVNLKRKPQRIAFVFFIISSVIYLIGLNTFSPGPVKDLPAGENLGLCIFINALLSILILVLFMNSFPKRGIAYKKGGKKFSINFIMLALTFAFLAIMIVMDVMYYNNTLKCIATNEAKFFNSMDVANKYEAYWGSAFRANPVLNPNSYKSYLIGSLELTIVHIVFLAISGVLLATMPLYKKLILKINTSKEVAGTEIKEAIDLED